MTPVLKEIAAERLRQILDEGWTAEHDDGHHNEGSLSAAASAYALHAYETLNPFRTPAPHPPGMWPFDEDWWKPKDPRRDLIRAAATIVAEIERLDRAAARKKEPIPDP
ncbi:MAG: hypothetical protein MI806_25920 [Minwuiales bacterium]|nr:hypothetical protein [Minwuiales bacterium]